MGDDGRAAVDLRYQPKVDGKGELHLLTLAQSEILGLDEHAARAQILRLANPALSSRHDDIHGRPRSVTGMQATLHSDILSLFIVATCHYAHRLPVSEGLAVTFIVMLSKSVD
jgi:hypothetical protein